MFSFLDNVFLFKNKTEENWPVGKKAAYYGYRALLLLAASAAMGATLLLFAYGDYSWAVFLGYLGNPKLLLLNILPVVLLIFFLWGLSGRPWLSFLLGGSLSLVLSLGHYYKLAFRDDPVIFEDLLILREAGTIQGEQYALFADRRIVFAVVCLLLATLVLFLFARGPVKNWKARLALVLAVLLAVFSLGSVYMDDALYESLGDYTHLNRWAPTQQFIARGFFYPFIHSISDAFDTPPDNYQTEDARALLSAYEDADIPADKKVNVISIMREAYVDFSRYDVEGLDTSAYDSYHALKSESISGDLLVNIFAGGTIDTERCFLTGNYQLKDFRTYANSYLWYLKDQGYTIEGSHPYYAWFYNRQNVNSYLGFDRYRFLEGDYALLTDAALPEDKTLYPEIYKDYAAGKETGDPYFSFSVTVQSHGPYPTGTYQGSRVYLNGDYSDECKNAMNHYMASIMSGDAALMDLVETLRSDEDPVVLLVFSDHLPWMGNSNSFYTEMGIDIDPSTESGFYNHYSTEYLIWANDAAKAVLENDFTGEGPTISPCYLMNLLFEACGWQGPAFMQAMDDMRDVFPIVTTLGRTMTDGLLSDTIPEDRRTLYRDLTFLQYLWRSEFMFK